jgi:CBS domain-containing protein
MTLIDLAPAPLSAAYPANDSTPADPTTVGAVASTVVVKVPGWFTAGAALRVARLKGAGHLLVVDRQRLVGSVSVARLAASPAHQPIDRVMNRSTATVSPDAPFEAARLLMERQGLDCLPVASGALLLGVVSRHPSPHGGLRAV